ncbi:MAG: ADP-heptose synthase bifunctional sugar [Bacteroidetes bacterium]|nr:MAG: ADP-heptose synthase bifunctional sugar [Bacteroidota bacterium]
MKTSPEKIKEAFAGFEGKHVLILGDVMIDSYLRGKVDRISPEAPVPVVLLSKRENMLGGAANVALNVRSLGAVPLLCSVIGQDHRAQDFIDLLQHDGISDVGIIRSTDRITTIKFRIIGNNYQMLRVDEEIDTDLAHSDEILLIQKAKEQLESHNISVIIFQDYNKGVLTPFVIDSILALAATRGIPVVVDPKKKNFNAYKGVELFKPNLKELREGLKTDVDASDIESLRKASAMLRQQQSVRSIMVTLSEKGVYLNREVDGKPVEVLIPAHFRNISDVSGAGDTVISIASLCLAANLSPELTVALSNLAGGLVCEHVGVVPIDKNRLFSEAMLMLTNIDHAGQP